MARKCVFKDARVEREISGRVSHLRKESMLTHLSRFLSSFQSVDVVSTVLLEGDISRDLRIFDRAGGPRHSSSSCHLG